MSEEKKKLNDVIVNTVDEELKKIFGETAALIIYGYLEDNLSLKRENIPEKIGLFSEGLDKFFGSGAYMLEKTILLNLYSSFGFDYKEKKGNAFADYVTELKHRLSANNSKHS
jgi:hypothetical protein